MKKKSNHSISNIHATCVRSIEDFHETFSCFLKNISGYMFFTAMKFKTSTVIVDSSAYYLAHRRIDSPCNNVKKNVKKM